MSGDQRITRKQADKNPELKKEFERYYTPPFASTPIPKGDPEKTVPPAIAPRTLFSEDLSIGSPTGSGAFDKTANLTIKTNTTLVKSSSEDSSRDSDDEKSETPFFEGAADISKLFERKNSNSSHSSLEDTEMATKQTISLKDALRVVPEFNGSNIPLSQFLEGCDIAKEMIEDADEKTFVKLLRSKITGEARQVIINTTFDTIEKIKDHLKSIYRPSRSVHQLLGELGNEFQREEESVVTYANRMRDLGNQIIEASKIANGTLQEGVKENTFASVIECFKKGLKPEIEQRIKREATIDEIMKDAIKIERLLEAQRNLRQSTKLIVDSKPINKRHIHYCIECQTLGHNSNECKKSKYCDFCRRNGHSTEQCFKKNTSNSNMMQVKSLQPTLTCQLCNKVGHTADKCYQLINLKPSNSSSQADPTKRPVCQFCEKIGHTADKCYSLRGPGIDPNKGQIDNRAQITCQICSRNGHTAATCRNRLPDQSSANTVSCSYCKNLGHTIQECRKREYNNSRKSGNEQGPQQPSVGREPITTKTRSMNATQIDDLLEELIPLD